MSNMKLRLLITGIAAFLFISVFSCKNNAASEEQTEEQTANPAQAEPEIPVTAIGWDVLEAMIPKTAANLPRTNTAEDRSGMGDLGFSHALGIYEKDKKRVELQILDSGNKKVILTTMASWYKREIDMEDDKGFEKTTTVKGFPAIEKSNKVSNSSEIGVVIKDRYIIMAIGQGVALEDLRKVVDGLDLKKLADM